MHIPDGFLSGKVFSACDVLAGLGLVGAVRQVKTIPRRRVPLLGMCGAFVFAAQMLNFPVAGGTSGHLLGGVLVAVLLGPGAGIVVVSSVLIVQCLLFADGGLLSLGANILNMAVVDSVGGYLAYRLIARLLPGRTGQLAGVGFGAWAGAVLASVVCAGELAVSGTVPARVVFPAMIDVHLLIGIGEALITTLAIFTVVQQRPELVGPLPDARSNADTGEPAPAGLRWLVVYGVVIAFALALFASPFASTWPDGLDRVSEKLGFAERAAEPLRSPLAGYKVPGLGSGAVATGVAGLVGTVVVLLLSIVLSKILLGRQATAGPDVGTPAAG